MKPEDIERLLNQPIYSWDASSLLGSIVNFLEYSEANLSWQREREIRRARQEAADLEFEPEDAHLLAQVRDQIIESAEYRFDLGLSQSVRTAGLVAYVTTIEWCSKTFESRLDSPLPKRPEKTNEAVHILNHLNQRVKNRLAYQIETLRNIIFVRNCIIHSAGLLKGDKYESEIRSALSTLAGFETAVNFIGESVHINRDAVDSLAREALIWIPSLDEECTNNGTFKTLYRT